VAFHAELLFRRCTDAIWTNVIYQASHLLRVARADGGRRIPIAEEAPTGEKWEEGGEKALVFSGNRARGALLSPKDDRASQASPYAWYQIP